MKIIGCYQGAECSYLAFVTEKGAAAPCATARTAAGVDVPAVLCDPVSPAEAEAMRAAAGVADGWEPWVVAVPTLSSDLRIALRSPGRDPLEATLGRREFARTRLFQGSRWRGVADAVRGSEYRARSGRTDVGPVSIIPLGAERVWRVRATFASATASGRPVLSALDSAGAPLDVDPIVLEDSPVTWADPLAAPGRVVTFSLRLPSDLFRLTLVAEVEGEPATRGFVSLDGWSRNLARECEERMRDAAHDPSYELWYSQRRATCHDVALQRARAEELGEALPTVEVLLLVGDASAEEAGPALDALAAQSYRRWTLTVVGDEARARAVAAAFGRGASTVSPAPREPALAAALRSAGTGLSLIAGCADLLAPDALWRLVGRATDGGEGLAADLVYCDSDHLEGGRFVSPELRTFPSLGTLRSSYYLGSPLLIGGDLAHGLAEAAPATLYDLALMAFERGARLGHEARVLSHRRSPAPVVGEEEGLAALEAHLARVGEPSRAVMAPAGGATYRVVPAPDAPAPRVSVVIPSRDHADLLDACVTSVLEKTDYPDLEVVVVENGSVEERTFELYRRLGSDPRVRVVTWEPPAGGAAGFNYSALVNFGAARTTGELLLFLNNDTRAFEAGWLREMVACLARPEVGVVGAKLLFEDGLVQHAGMVAKPDGSNMHVNRDLPAEAPGYLGTAVLVSDMNMVTGACQLTRRSVFDRLGGYDERLAVGYNDADYCLRAREAGHAVTFTPFARLFHREFSSRGREDLDAEKRARLLGEHCYNVGRHAGFYGRGDATMNPGLDHCNEYYHLTEV